jgi:hypothetical protein
MTIKSPNGGAWLVTQRTKDGASIFIALRIWGRERRLFTVSLHIGPGVVK